MSVSWTCILLEVNSLMLFVSPFGKRKMIGFLKAAVASLDETLSVVIVWIGEWPIRLQMNLRI